MSEPKREPLTDSQMRINAAALAAFPDLVHPEDEEMREVCESLVDRGSLVEVRENADGDLDPDADMLIGYQASAKLRAAMMMRSAMN